MSSSGPLSCHCQVVLGAGVQATSMRSTRTRQRPRRSVSVWLPGGQRERHRARGRGRARGGRRRDAASRRSGARARMRIRVGAPRARAGGRAWRAAGRSRSEVPRQPLGLDALRRRRQQRRGQRERDHRFCSRVTVPLRASTTQALPRRPRARSGSRRRARRGSERPVVGAIIHTSPLSSIEHEHPVAGDRERTGRAADGDRRALRAPGAGRQPGDGPVAAVGDPDRAVADGDVLRVATDGRAGGRSRGPRAGRSARPCRRRR